MQISSLPYAGLPLSPSGQSALRTSPPAKAGLWRFRLADLVNRTLQQTEAFKRPHLAANHGFLAQMVNTIAAKKDGFSGENRKARPRPGVFAGERRARSAAAQRPCCHLKKYHRETRVRANRQWYANVAQLVRASDCGSECYTLHSFALILICPVFCGFIRHPFALAFIDWL